MDQEILVEDQINEGRKLIDLLIEKGTAVVAAAWVKETDGGLWFFYLVMPLVDATGTTRSAYRRINEATRKLPDPPGVDPLRIRAIASKDDAGQAILDFQRRHLVRKAWWYDKASLGDVSIDAAYIYRTPVFTEAS